jgi:hypothetical protein
MNHAGFIVLSPSIHLNWGIQQYTCHLVIKSLNSVENSPTGRCGGSSFTTCFSCSNGVFARLYGNFPVASSNYKKKLLLEWNKLTRLFHGARPYMYPKENISISSRRIFSFFKFSVLQNHLLILEVHSMPIHLNM